jgi:hypothetical protein
MKKKVAATVAASLLFGMSLAPVMAQDTAPGANDTAIDRTVVDDRDDDGFDWGLLGLLGLLGLIPRKQKTVVHHDTTRTTNTTGTPR